METHTQQLMDGMSLEHCKSHVSIVFDTPHRVLSSAVLNGGLLEADNIVNLKVPKRSDNSTVHESPDITLKNYCEERWDGTTVGMMTAASMTTMRWAIEQVEDIQIAAVATAGITNPRRAGDRAELRTLGCDTLETGTINVILLTTATLAPAAMTETLLIATEAKAAALQNLKVLSPVSGLVATGTGTDAMAVACRTKGNSVRYAGKHVIFGETVARLVIKVITDSLNDEHA